MASEKELQNEHELALEGFLAARGGKGQDSEWALVRALVHKAVHLAADTKAVEYCAVSTLLAEMIGHAHAVMHPQEAGSTTTAGVH